MTPALARSIPIRNGQSVRIASCHSSTLGFLVMAYVVLLPYQIQINAQLNLAPADLFLLLTLLLVPGQLKYRSHAWSIPHFALLFVFVAGTFVTALRDGTLTRYVLLNKDVGLLLLILSYFAITTLVTEWQQVRRILRVFTLGVVFQNVPALGAFLAKYFYGINIAPPFTSYGGARLSGMLIDANAYGGLLVLALVICEGSSWGRAPLFQGRLLLFCRLTLGLGILFSFSRSAWISLALALLVLCMFRRRKALRLALMGAVGLPCLFLFMGQRFLRYFESMASRPEQVQGRFDLMWRALSEFAQRPFLGGGLGSFLITAGTVAHNTALWFLAEFGIVGLVVLLAFIGWFFAEVWTAYRYAPADEKPIMLALLMGHTAMFGLAMGIEAFYQRHWWLILALIASSSTIVRRQLRSERGENLRYSRVG